MSLYEQIDKDYLEAYKARETTRVGVLRLLKTAVKNRLVEVKRPGGTLDDEEMLDVILKQAKQRQDSIEQYLAAHRKDLADKEEAELAILNQYLPARIDADTLNQAIRDAARQCGATGPKDMGKVIGLILARYKGQVDGKEVSEAVRKYLAAAS